MHVVIVETTELPAPPADAWAHMTDIASLTDFVGYGPIPGIASARWIQGTGAKGSIREVTNTDGSRHREEVIDVQQLRRLEDRIYDVSSPFRFLVREARDIFELSESPRGTRLVRTFRFELRSRAAWPIAKAVAVLFRRAVRRHHETVERALRAR